MRLAVAVLFGFALAGACDGQPGEQKVGASPVPVARPAASFDRARAWKHLEQLVSFGPRPSGSAQLAEARKYITTELKSYGLAVREQSFTAKTPVDSVPMSNVIAELPGASPDVLIVASHYDTKRLARFVGANDGGSSTAVLLEIARQLSLAARSTKPALTVWFVFFDGEEAVVHWTEDDSLYGSRHFVDDLEASGADARVRAVVLLDMVGDKDLRLKREGASSRELVDIIWQSGAELGYAANFQNVTQWLDDDHIPFLDAGIPAVDVIDFEYGNESRNYGPGGPGNAYWHTEADTLDKCSADSLGIVGETIIHAAPRIMARLAGSVRR
jgi:Zn-dependent M28 family amino/carboxypeptidase